MATILRLDPIRCDGYGMCAELLPELLSLDEWGYPVIRPVVIPDGLLDHARRAVDVCPVLALRLQDASTAGRRLAGPGAVQTPAANPRGAVAMAAHPRGAEPVPASAPPTDARSPAGA